MSFALLWIESSSNASKKENRMSKVLAQGMYYSLSRNFISDFQQRREMDKDSSNGS